MLNPTLVQTDLFQSESTLANSIPAGFIERLLAKRSAAWKWPQYKAAIYADRFFSSEALKTGKRQPGIVSKIKTKFLRSQVRSLMSAGFIEWKYYSILSAEFHGIVGLSLYNPEEKFSLAAEGGLLLVVAGQLGNNQLVYMKLFPESCLTGLNSSTLRAVHGSVSLSLSDDSKNAEISIKDKEDFELNCTIQGDDFESPWRSKPLVGMGLNPLPSGHWIVHNHIPVGTSSGLISVSDNFIQSLEKNDQSSTQSSKQNPAPKNVHVTATDFDVNSYWIKGDSNLDSNLKWAWNKSPSYFEHSFGLHPLPSQGWDFFFAPLSDQSGGAALQSYKNCADLKQLDLYWIDPESEKKCSTSFKSEELVIEWAEKEYDRKMDAWIPTLRILRGKNESFVVELKHRIQSTLRFLRPQTAAVRCFFIGEQIGTASWTLSDRKGNILQKVTDTLAGGEIAYARFPSLGKRTQPFPV